MATRVRMPDLGTVEGQVTLVRWLKAEGEAVSVGEPLFEVETDKGVSEVEATMAGVLERRVLAPGARAGAGETIAFIRRPGEAEGEGATAAGDTAPAAARAAARAAVATPAPAVPSAHFAPAPSAAGPQPGPSIRALAERRGVDLSRVKATGPGGRITRQDVLAAAARAGTQSPEWQLDLYRQMVLIRQFEERVKFLFLEGVMPGTIHQSQGQEACAVGVCAALGQDDVITSTHRPHGHAIARGLSVDSLMAELFGKVTGCCKGKGGSMHMGDLSKGMVPAVAIVGGALPMAAGIALSFKMKKEARVAVAFMGDGATNEGTFHEALNMAAIWDLPVVFVVENNLYGASTPVKMVVKTPHIADRAAAYGMPGATVDGNDVLAVHAAARAAVARAREGGGPTLLELETYRITGHSRRDPCLYQPEEERKRAVANEPIGRFAKKLLAGGTATQADLDAAAESVKAEIEAAVTKAMADPLPAPEDTMEDLWV